MPEQPTYILGIESSCDDTAAAVLADAQLLSNVLPLKPFTRLMEVLFLAASRSSSQYRSCGRSSPFPSKYRQKTASCNRLYPRTRTARIIIGRSQFCQILSSCLEYPLIEVNHLHGHLMAHFIADTHPKLPTFPCLGLPFLAGIPKLFG